jgi:hypothetical protein
MDSTQRRQARMQMMKQRQALMEKKTKEEDISAQRLQRIMRSTRQDSTLRKRVRSAVRETQRSQMQQGGPAQGGSPQGGGN